MRGTARRLGLVAFCAALVAGAGLGVACGWVPNDFVIGLFKPGTPTLLMSYTRDGVFRWKVTDSSMPGGHPSMITVLPGPWLSPAVVMRNA